MTELNTFTYYNEDLGEIRVDEYINDGKRVPGPEGYSVREYYPEDNFESDEEGHNIKSEMWFENNLLHREDGPAFQEWHHDGSTKCIEYWQDGLMSREEGPAAVEYFESLYPDQNGNIRCEQWRQNDLLHRTDGPAVIIHHESKQKQISEEQWWIDGQRRTEGGPAIKRRNKENEIIHQLNWTSDSITLGEKDYSNIDYGPWVNLDHWNDEKSQNILLRLWHRWVLGLEQVSDDWDFMYADWVIQSTLNELKSRLSYFPAGHELANHIYSNQNLEKGENKTNEEIVRNYLRFILDQNIDEDINKKIQQAIDKEFTYVDMVPIGSSDDWKLDKLFEHLIEEADTPRIISMSLQNSHLIYAEYWYTQHIGTDLTPWFQFVMSGLNVIAGPTGIVAGKY